MFSSSWFNVVPKTVFLCQSACLSVCLLTELEEKIDVVFLMSTESLCSNVVMTTEFSMQLV